ncbi:hypothetical protein [Antarctobacter sp.]|uniref:hypothetical protein n=1 Tax=Antarctobacter sp. TaxID=1872577 RepID=UPI003A9304B2
MARYKMIVQLDPGEGREDAFLDFYPQTHVRDILTVPGVLSAQFLRRVHAISDAGPHEWAYMVIYEVECDDPKELQDAMVAGMKSGAIRADFDLLKAERRTVFYEALTDVLSGTTAGTVGGADVG